MQLDVQSGVWSAESRAAANLLRAPSRGGSAGYPEVASEVDRGDDVITASGQHQHADGKRPGLGPVYAHPHTFF